MPTKVRSAVAPHCVGITPRVAAPYELRRGSAHSRGYGRTWEKLRLLILHRDPLCVVRKNVLVYLEAHRQELGAALISELQPYIFRLCFGNNISRQIDHVVPKPLGDDVEENLQGCCDGCHSLKTWMDALCMQRGRGGLFSAVRPAADRQAAHTRVAAK